MIRVALIGYGYAGKTFHAPLIAATPGLSLALIASSDAAKVLVDWPDVEVENDPYRAINRGDIDLIVIATPNVTHAPLAQAALQSGKHVVVDKPFTVSAAEARALERLSSDSHKLLSVFHNRRWDSDFLTLKEILESGSLGEVLYVESRFDRFRPEVKARWREQAGPGSGLWYDLGPHLLDQALTLFGEPQTVRGTLATQRPDAQTTDWFQAQLDYGRLQVVLSASMLIAAPLPRFAVHGTQGSWIKYGLDIQEEQLKAGMKPGDDGWGAELKPGRIYRAEGGEESSPLARGDYRVYYSEVAAAIRGDGLNPVTPAQACKVMDIIEQIAEAAES